MQVSPSSGADPVFPSTDTSIEPLSDLMILRQAIPDDCSVDDRGDLQQRKREILDKLIKQRLVDAELDLSRVELTELNLSGVNLQSANLEDAKLRKTNLDQACLSGANLDYADLTEAKLNTATLSHAMLYRTQLSEADLSNANLEQAKLNNVQLYKASLINTKLMKADLQEVGFVRAKMQLADFSNSNLQSCIFTEAYLTNADLKHTNLSFANFTQAMLKGANLRNANFTGANLNRADLTDANLDGANLSNIYFPHWNNIQNLDRYLNHINNDFSLLTTIDSINAKYYDLKIDLVHQLINSLDKRSNEVSLSSVVEPLLDTLAKAPYNSDQKIIEWINNNILPLYLVKYDAMIMPVPPEPLLKTLLNCFNLKSALMFSHNGAFIQLISQAMVGNSSLSEQVKALYNHYLQDSRVEPYTKDLNFGNYAGQADWSDNEANNFILLSAEKNSHYAMMISQDRLCSMLDVETKSNMIWNGFYLFQAGEIIPTEQEGFSLTDLFNHHFKIFASNYQFHQHQAKFGKLLATLALGELQAVFQKATTQRFCQIKLIDYDSQAKLAAIFDNKFKQYMENGVTGYHLTVAYTQQLLQAYNLSNADKTTQAKTLLSLAAVFSKYSSSAIFGTESESPNALRYFAFALLEKAYKLSPPILSSEVQYKDWTNRLLGYNQAFSCTAVLSTDMINYIKDHFPNTLAGIIPPAWR